MLNAGLRETGEVHWHGHRDTARRVTSWRERYQELRPLQQGVGGQSWSDLALISQIKSRKREAELTDRPLHCMADYVQYNLQEVRWADEVQAARDRGI